jgi:hypothetical protein
MPEVIANYDFTIEANPACWTGPPSHFELKLLQTLPIYALEELRARFVQSVTTTQNPTQAARRVFQMAFETEIGAAIAKVIDILPDQASALVCPARRYLEIDADMAPFSFLYEPALTVIAETGILPVSYVNLFRAHITSPYARYRMCGIAALLCVVAALTVPDQTETFELVFADSISSTDGAVDVPGQVIAKADTVSISETHNVIAEVVYQDNPVAVDTVHFSRGLGRFDNPVAVDAASVVYTQGSFWRAQTAPVSLPLGGLDPHSSFFIVDDFEIYMAASDSGSTPYIWKWDGTSWTSCPTTGMSSTTHIWGTHDGGAIYVMGGGLTANPWKSTNHGASFLPLPWPFFASNPGLYGFENQTTGVVTLFAALNGGGAVMTVDDGAHWTTVMPPNEFGANNIDVIWGTSPTNVYFGGSAGGNSVLAHWDGSSLTDLSSLVSPIIDRIYSMWGSNANNIYIGGYHFGGGNNILCHTTDAFTTITEEALPFGGSLNNVYSLSGIDATQLFATAQGGGTSNIVIHHFDVINPPDVWANDGALTTPTGDAICAAVNPATGRAVLINALGYLQTNKTPAPGRASSPRELAADTATAADAVVVQVNP